ncbi:PQQ-dependent sugar dehydrogenase [Rubellimicrobium roseum]|uniref:PQQ-dependent sugar dehydrogenase n=1 Tax=Rubellimicrobium roseum TaxID=687525 RepID=UPI001C3F25CB|nr:sorbosone dehydrogenase family protein [Rubellimicrobium roseum]
MAFAEGLDHPRWLYVLPNGDVLVAETNKQPAPPRSLRGFFQQQLMQVAGAEVPSADRISLLRDQDGDGVADLRTVLLNGLTSPFGMALVDDTLYVANTDALLRFRYRPGATRIEGPGERVLALPANPPNYHWTKGLLASDDGRQLFVSVGSNSDHAESGLDAERGRAAIWEIDLASGSASVFASGLRNPVGMDFEPQAGALWTVVNERDELGSDLVPDYLTRVREGEFYGWPFSYWGGNLDPRVHQTRLDLVARAVVPDYALGAHVAPLGLVFAEGARLGPRFQEGALIGRHGSWNRRPPSGYDVIFVPFRDGAPAAAPIQVLTAFLGPDGEARGRPVGVAVARDGALLVADDVGNAIWRVSAKAATE